MSIHIYKGYVVEMTHEEKVSSLDSYIENVHTGDIYLNGELVASKEDISEASALSRCISFIELSKGDNND